MTASGNPAWERVAGITDYGGHTSKTNYMAQGVVNPRTDVGAEAIMRMADHLAAVANVSPFAVINYTQDDTGTNDPVVNSAYLMTGADSDGYPDGGTPPTGYPTLSRNGNGDVTVTFASSYNDSYGTAGTFSVSAAQAFCNDSSSSIVCDADIISTVAVRVRSYVSNTGVASTDSQVTLLVW